MAACPSTKQMMSSLVVAVGILGVLSPSPSWAQKALIDRCDYPKHALFFGVQSWTPNYPMLDWTTGTFGGFLDTISGGHNQHQTFDDYYAINPNAGHNADFHYTPQTPLRLSIQGNMAPAFYDWLHRVGKSSMTFQQEVDPLQRQVANDSLRLTSLQNLLRSVKQDDDSIKPVSKDSIAKQLQAALSSRALDQSKLDAAIADAPSAQLQNGFLLGVANDSGVTPFLSFQFVSSQLVELDLPSLYRDQAQPSSLDVVLAPKTVQLYGEHDPNIPYKMAESSLAGHGPWFSAVKPWDSRSFKLVMSGSDFSRASAVSTFRLVPHSNPYYLRPGSDLVLTMPAADAQKLNRARADSAKFTIFRTDGSVFTETTLYHPRVTRVSIPGQAVRRVEGSSGVSGIGRVFVNCDYVDLAFRR